MSGPRFLIVKYSAIGDCVMAAPVATAIRNTYPDAFIAWAVEDRCKDVIDTERLVDLRYEIPWREWRNAVGSWRRQIKYYARLRRFRFDFGIDLQGHSKTAFCMRIAGPRVRVATKATDPLARVMTPIAPTSTPVQHTVERNLEALAALGKFEGGIPPIMPNVQSEAEEFSKSAAGRPLATIMLGTGHPSKSYAAERWADVARRMLSEGYAVSFLGGPDDQAPSVSGAVDWVGKLALRQTMAAVVASDIHLAADTGTGHIAAAYGVPVVSVFGFTDSRVYRPYTDYAIVLDAGMRMDRVQPEEIVVAALKLAGRRNAILS